MAKKEKGQPQENDPLQAPPPEAVRFNRRVIAAVAGVVAVLITVAVVGGLTAKTKAEERKVSASAGKEDKLSNSPEVADPIRDMPGSYPEASKSASRQPQRQKDAKETSAGPEAVAQPDTPSEAQQPVPAYTVRAPGQMQKDAASAVNSPLTFGGGEAPQPRREEPAPLAIPVLPDKPRAQDRNAAADDQNMQGEKRRFLREREAELPYLKTTLTPPLSRYEIKAGTILPALLITGINSDLPGQIVAQVRENVYDTVTGNYLLIPQGTRLIGEYDSKIAFGQERVLVVWTRLIMPNGDSINLEGMPGADLSGYAGVTGEVNNHYGKLVAGVVLGSVIGAGAQVAVGGQGAPNVPPSFGQLAVSGAAQSINQSAQQHTDKVLNLQPTIEVTPGDKINVFVTKDMVLKPFAE